MTTEQIPLRAGWTTSSGKVRDHNEDAIGVSEQPDASLYAIADGVGGAEAGELVSTYCIQSVLTEFHNSPDSAWKTMFLDALDQVNAEVRRFTEEISANAGRELHAGSTFTGVVIEGSRATIAHVGDSRLYHWRSGTAMQMTQDHSRAPDHDPTAQKHNVLVRGIGKDDYIQPDVFTLDLMTGDRLLICSDGMSDRISEEQISQTLGSMEPVQAAEYLAAQAEKQGSSDNISVLVIYLGAGAHVRVKTQRRVYTGYDPNWRLRLDAQPRNDSYQEPSGTSRRPLILVAVTGILLAVLIVVIIGVIGANGGIAVPVFARSASATPTVTSTPTPTLTLTPTATPTPSPTNTPLPPPTATLRHR